MPGRIIAIGDIHGCVAALDAVLPAVDPGPDDTVVTLGDYVDRGPDSRGVIDRLIDLSGRCRLVPLRGNHDLMFEGAIEAFERSPGPLSRVLDHPELMMWLEVGGMETIASYGSLADVPPGHAAFLRGLRDGFESESHLFIHANYDPDRPIDDQRADLAFWVSIRDDLPGPHRSGKVVVVGHTSQKDGKVADYGHLICLDTYCYGGGWLTAMDLDTRRVWQADRHGILRA